MKHPSLNIFLTETHSRYNFFIFVYIVLCCTHDFIDVVFYYYEINHTTTKAQK